jgi:hypothetical protein
VVHRVQEDGDLEGTKCSRGGELRCPVDGERGGRGTYLDHALERAAGRLEDVLEVLAAGGRLVGDAALDEVARCVTGDLAGDPNLRAGLDGLGLWGAMMRGQIKVVYASRSVSCAASGG